MTISHYTDGLPTAPELVKNGRKSVGAQKAKASTQQLFAIHGLLLVFTFVILMPLGIAGIRSGHQNSFKIHWIVQICSTSIAVVTMGLSVCLSWEMIRVTRSLVRKIRKRLIRKTGNNTSRCS
jgi:protein-S-isoprenylcysteine O-methyltransferase Ste14